jgi:hypothetical protein
MREALYKVFAPGSTSGNLQRLCVTETEGEEPLAFRINLERRHLVGTGKPIIATSGIRGCMRPANSERLRRVGSALTGPVQEGLESAA